MKFMVTFTGHRSTHKASMARFSQESATPPPNIKVLGQWHGFGKGYMVIQCSDIKAAYAYAASWSDLQDITVEPVLDNTEIIEVIKSVK